MERHRSAGRAQISLHLAHTVKRLEIVVVPEVKDDPAIYPSPEVSAKLFNLRAHTPDYDETLTETWQRIKAVQRSL